MCPLNASVSRTSWCIKLSLIFVCWHHIDFLLCGWQIYCPLTLRPKGRGLFKTIWKENYITLLGLMEFNHLLSPKIMS